MCKIDKFLNLEFAGRTHCPKNICTMGIKLWVCMNITIVCVVLLNKLFVCLEIQASYCHAKINCYKFRVFFQLAGGQLYRTIDICKVLFAETCFPFGVSLLKNKTKWPMPNSRHNIKGNTLNNLVNLIWILICLLIIAFLFI